MKTSKLLFNWKILSLLLCFQILSSSDIAEDTTFHEIESDTLNQKIVQTKSGLVYIFEIRKEIAKPVWRITQKAFAEAVALKADYILIHMNTYGGMVNIADSIRTKILNSTIPVMIFIDNQAISAGALISIAADSIYMRTGASIGAATVVNQSGEVVPDKYQSFMRSTMRATAEAHGKDTIINGNDTTLVWHRDPDIAQAMVDPKLYVEGVIDSGQVLTLTVEEAIKVGYCEGQAMQYPEQMQVSPSFEPYLQHREEQNIAELQKLQFQEEIQHRESGVQNIYRL